MSLKQCRSQYYHHGWVLDDTIADDLIYSMLTYFMSSLREIKHIGIVNNFVL